MTTTRESALSAAYGIARDKRVEAFPDEGYPKRHAFTEGFTEGYEAGAFDERMRIVEFIADNQESLKTFAGDRASEMLAFMLREMTPDA